MKKILLALTIAGVFTACGNGGDSAADADSTATVNSTTPPPTSDTTNPIGVMMSDTSITAADSLVAPDSIE
jgi:ABC-type glycerol-3-phosphate transport system substrate-binding protein